MGGAGGGQSWGQDCGVGVPCPQRPRAGHPRGSHLGSARTQSCHPKPQRTGCLLGHRTGAQGGGPLRMPRPRRPQTRTISRWVNEAENAESVVLPLGGHSQLLHGGARLQAATFDVSAHCTAPPPGGPALPPPAPRRASRVLLRHSREGRAGSAGSSSGGPRRPHTSPRTRAG